MGFDPGSVEHYPLDMTFIRKTVFLLFALGIGSVAISAFAQSNASLFEPMRAEGDHNLLETLYQDLAVAEDQDAAKIVADNILKIWMRSGSDTVDLLTERAHVALEAEDAKTAEKLLDAVVDIAPNFAEGWNRRATLYFVNKDYARSMADVQRVLALDPLHFGALSGLGAMLQETGLEAAALNVYRKALKVHPYLPGARREVEKLQVEVEGRKI